VFAASTDRSRSARRRSVLGAPLLAGAVCGAAMLWMLLFAAGAHALTCDVEYSGPSGGSWATEGSWSDGKLPKATQNACIPAGKGTIEVPAGFKAEAKSLTAQSALKIAATGTLAILQTVEPENSLANEERASRLNGLTVEGTLTTAGAWILMNGPVAVEGEIKSTAATNAKNEDVARLLSGTLVGDGTIDMPFSNIAGTVEPGGAGVIGTLHLTSLSSQASGGTLVLDLASSSSFDKVADLTSNFFMRGTLEINLIGGYDPASHEKWEFMSKGPGVSVEFETFDPTTFTARSVSGGAEIERLPLPPIVVTEPATSVTGTTAVLNGTVNPNNLSVFDCEFEYGPTITYGSHASCSALGGHGSTPLATDAGIFGLSPGSTYHFRLVAKSEGGTGEGGDRTFKTAAATAQPPTSVTVPASAVSETAATLNGTVNPNGASISACEIRYGLTPSYGSSTTCAVAGAGSTPVAVTEGISGLTAGTTYHFRIFASNAAGPSEGEDLTFTTPAPISPVSPVSPGLPANPIVSTGSVLGATISAPLAQAPGAVEELLRGCSSPLVLNDAYIHGNRVYLAGSAAKSLIAKKVEIIFGTAAKKVASATVGANGQFTTTAPLPPAKIREALKTYYAAEIGSQRSLHLKLTRRLLLEPPTASGHTVTLSGRVTLPLTKPITPIVVEQQLECHKTTIADTFTPPASGAFHITIPVPAGARAGIYTLKSKVAANAHALAHGFTTYSLPLPVALG